MFLKFYFFEIKTVKCSEGDVLENNYKWKDKQNQIEHNSHKCQLFNLSPSWFQIAASKYLGINLLRQI